ncbi:MAG: sugar phosphate isomerase/epimerase [Acidobacteriaceae bacterium]|nr:sugar phosphate isomerase/epimerase [Acidobacteriaceae bacterium]
MAEQPTTSASLGQMGIATTSYMTAWRPQDTSEFLERCHALGAAGIQAPINGDLKAIRARAEQLNMYIEAMVPLPHDGDTSAFEQSLKNAEAVGAIALRSACLGTRRYETFSSLADWQAFVARSNASLEAAVPILEKHKLPLGLENHKDWTVDELVALLKRYSSEYLGTCLDFGNNISLLDDPMDVVEKLAPYAVSTHLKDMGVAPYPDGFLLSEVLLGDGFLDLSRMVSLVRQSRPNTRFSLEMITRDPLKVPCLTDKYWVTFPDRNGLYLARTLRLVQEKQSSKSVPHVSQLSHEEQLRVEEENVVSCLRYAHEKLSL